MSVLPKLHYFPVPGRAEPIRIAASIGNIQFQEVNIAHSEWADKKASYPFQQLPVWEEEGKPILPQSNAILLYVGKQAGLYPTDAWQAVRHHIKFNSQNRLW